LRFGFSVRSETPETGTVEGVPAADLCGKGVAEDDENNGMPMSATKAIRANVRVTHLTLVG